MDREQDYASNTDESDEDFRPDDVAGESPASEEDSDTNEVLEEDPEDFRKKRVKRKGANKHAIRKKIKSKHEDESDDENRNTSRRLTRRKGCEQINGKRENLEKQDLLSDEEEKSRTNALWADFLNDVKPIDNLLRVNQSKVDNIPSSSGVNGKESSEKTKEDIRTKISPKVEKSKIVVTEVLDFAGEEVSIQREVDVSSIKENKATVIQTPKKQPFSRIMPGVGMKRLASAAATATGTAPGLGSILNQLGKKKKLSILEKSQMDWKSYKQSEGIDEQLQTFNKGKDGYLERQDFLQRTDLRQFEIEKNLRQTTRRSY